MLTGDMRATEYWKSFPNGLHTNFANTWYAKPFWGCCFQLNNIVGYNFHQIRCGVDNADALWAFVLPYRHTLSTVSLKICYLADEPMMKRLRAKAVIWRRFTFCSRCNYFCFLSLLLNQLSPTQQELFDYCQGLGTAERFDACTNIRELVIDELKFHYRRIGTSYDLLHDVGRASDFIADIYKEFVPIPDAWNWTLLKDLVQRVLPEEVNANMVSIQFSIDNFFGELTNRTVYLRIKYVNMSVW